MATEDHELPTIGELISSWLGVQLPTMRMPQTLKNLDKALSKIVLAGSENIETRIRGSTNRREAQDNIDLQGMFRT
jgi:hypothetical protein